MTKQILLATVCVALFSTTNAQDFKMPAPSPNAKVTQQFSTTHITIDYSRPSIKGRSIYGGLVPFDKKWRTGANASTKITFGEDVRLEGEYVSAGTYSLYTIPGKESWQIILNKGLENWGLSGYDAGEDIVKVNVKPINLEKKVETFTIAIDDITNTSGTLALIWENTYVPIKIVADNKQKILDYLQTALKSNNPPYQQAANYYLEQNYKLDEALTYVDKAIEKNKEAFWLHWLKAKIYAKMGNKNAAISSASQAAKMASGSEYESEYAKNLAQLKEELN